MTNLTVRRDHILYMVVTERTFVARHPLGPRWTATTNDVKATGPSLLLSDSFLKRWIVTWPRRDTSLESGPASLTSTSVVLINLNALTTPLCAT